MFNLFGSVPTKVVLESIIALDGGGFAALYMRTLTNSPGFSVASRDIAAGNFIVRTEIKHTVTLDAEFQATFT